jgi:hypothetical protein
MELQLETFPLAPLIANVVKTKVRRRRSRPRRQPRQFRLYSRAVATRSVLAWLPASIGQAVI